MRRLLFITAFAHVTTVGLAHAQVRVLNIEGVPGTNALPTLAANGTGYVAAASLALFGAALELSAEALRVTWLGDTLVFTLGSPYFTAGRDIVQLTHAVQRIGGETALPAQFFTEWLPVRWPAHFTFRDPTLRVTGLAPARPPPSSAAPRMVVLDPGHGGNDSGKIGPNRLREKDATLQLARLIADRLGPRGYEVRMTRTTDTLIALADRPRLANRWKADRPALFLSIHMNSTTSSQVRGFETFFLSQARTDDERRVAEMENAAAAFEDGPSQPTTQEDMILSGLRNDFYVRASNDLAEEVQRALRRVHDGPDRGVKRAGFRVLIGALMPAVLIEVGFISNPAEAGRLGDAVFQARLADAIAAAVDAFFEKNAHLWAGT